MTNINTTTGSKRMDSQRWEVRQYTLCDGWTNTWLIGEPPVPQTFRTRAAAQRELDEFLQEMEDEVQRGEREEEDAYDVSEFTVARIVPRLHLLPEQFQSRDNPKVDTPEEIRAIMLHADSCIDTECDNYEHIAALAIDGLSLHTIVHRIDDLIVLVEHLDTERILSDLHLLRAYARKEAS